MKMTNVESGSGNLNIRAVVLTADKFEDMELFVPYFRLLDAGAHVDIASPTMDDIGGEHGYTITPDLLISDVSSVVTDFLYSRKPYVVTNPHELDDEAFRAEYPSAAAAALVSPATIDRLAGIVDDARGADLLRTQRDVVATYLLGAERADPLAGFTEAVDAALATQAARTRGRT